MNPTNNQITLRMRIASLFLAASLYAAVAPPLVRTHQPDTEIRTATITEKGAALYARYCSLCHGNNGEGYLADNANALSNQDFLVSASDEYILQGILQGRPGTPMSAWSRGKGGSLAREEASAIVSFIRTWQKTPSLVFRAAAVKGNAENGASLYERWCAACHGKQGNGNNAPQLGNPVFQQTAGDAFIHYAIRNGRRGTSMTAYKQKLNSQEINDVVSFIRTLRGKDAPLPSVSLDNEAYSREDLLKGVLNPGNPSPNFTLIENRYVSAEDVHAAYQAAQTMIIIDARPGSDFVRSHIKGALSIPFYDIASVVGLLPKDIWIITYCVCPHALSGRAADLLKAGGYQNVAVLNEGFFFWKKKGYPSETTTVSGADE